MRMPRKGTAGCRCPAAVRAGPAPACAHEGYQPVGEEGIGAQGQLRPVLLERSERPHHRAAGSSCRRLQLRPGELLEPALA